MIAPTHLDGNAISTLSSTVEMPDYALWPNIYMQEDPNWCRAGVIQTVLMYTVETSPSQQTIINNCAAALPSIAAYINERLPTSYVDYLYTLYGGDQEEFN